MFGRKRPLLIQFAGSLANIQTLSMSIDCLLCCFGPQHTQQCYMEWNTERMTEQFDIVTPEG